MSRPSSVKLCYDIYTFNLWKSKTRVSRDAGGAKPDLFESRLLLIKRRLPQSLPNCCFCHEI